MKITIAGGNSQIEREAKIAAQSALSRAHLPLAQRRKIVADLIAKNRRSRFTLITGGLPDKPQ